MIRAMENVVLEQSSASMCADEQDVKTKESAENFQKFVYELFEKNGVINDLRAYLRGHIVNVLRSTQSGNPPVCQRHFTQRLELTFQALNMLVAEYLLSLEFSYTFSVFISEIPLANMVFAFAKSLMQGDTERSDLRFKDADVWSILNYLGVQCDSEHASRIVEMYKKDHKAPLLLCILKCTPMYKEPLSTGTVNSQEQFTSEVESSGSEDHKNRSPHRNTYKCKHYALCKSCQNMLTRSINRYKKKKQNLVKTVKDCDVNPLNVEYLRKNIDSMERTIIEEMFEQLKSVYEAEYDMMKKDEEKRLKKSLAVHVMQLQKKRVEMEESFKTREAELERNIQQKKRFLWDLARSLREQHVHMSRAMHDVKQETRRLTAKEDSLKTQLAEAEQILRQRGEDMRKQISSELTILEQHLESMKQERHTLNKERSELEQIKQLCETNKVENEQRQNVDSHYDLLKNELSILKKYLETAKLEPKCVVERYTMTDFNETTSKTDVLNNGHEPGRSEDKVKPNQVVNDLKKQKNVNFSQAHLDEVYSHSRSRSRSSGSSQAGDAQFAQNAEFTQNAQLAQNELEQNSIHVLREENERLRNFARQQRSQLEELRARFTRPRPRTAPPAPAPAPARAQPVFQALHGLSASASVNNFCHGWRKGAGEELSFFSNAEPRILVPGDTVPFIGIVSGTRHTDNRRYLINQWRTLRRRISPQGAVTKMRANSPGHRDRTHNDRTNCPGTSAWLPTSEEQDQINYQNAQANGGNYGTAREDYHRPRSSGAPETKTREKSPKSVLREAKEKLKNKVYAKTCPTTTRDKSPNTVLREAKLRLRKLEIEAEAVEKSYLDFRRNHELRDENRAVGRDENDVTSDQKDLGLDVQRKNLSNEAFEATAKGFITQYDQPHYSKDNIDKYFREFRNKFDIGEKHFNNKNATPILLKPIPRVYSNMAEIGTEKSKFDYLETPLTEFRKYYCSDKRYINDKVNISCSLSPDEKLQKSDNSNKGIRKQYNMTLDKRDKAKELEILKENIDKIYNIPEKPIEETDKSKSDDTLKVITNAQDKTNNYKTHIENQIAQRENQLANSDNEVCEITHHRIYETDMIQSIDTTGDQNNKNLLRVEVESVCEVKDIKLTDSRSQDLTLRIESSITNESGESETDTDKDALKGKITIIVSPNIDRKDTTISLPSTRNNEKMETIGDDLLQAIYQSKNGEHKSSSQLQMEPSKDNKSEFGEIDDPDYTDEFLADVDNYNSILDTNSIVENNSPISLQKTSEDDNFWES